METQKILDRMFPIVAVRHRRRVLVAKLTRWVKQSIGYLILGFLLIIAWIAGHLYYYNKLVDMEYDIQASWAQVETQWQRRNHIQRHLTRIVLEYAKHERGVLTALTEMRSGLKIDNLDKLRDQLSRAPGGPPLAPPAIEAPPEKIDGARLDKLLSQIKLVAEQYPKLRLSENFQQFSKATIETENQIAEQIQHYNEAVNDYTTELKQFPGNVFGKVCGFLPYKFYNPPREILQYQPLQLKDPPRGVSGMSSSPAQRTPKPPKPAGHQKG